MQVSQQQAEVDQRVQILHVLVGHAGGGPVVEHQQHASDRQQQEEEERQATQAEGVGDAQALAAYPHRMKVQEYVVEHDERLLARG